MSLQQAALNINAFSPQKLITGQISGDNDE